MSRCRVAIVDDNGAFAESLALALVIRGGVETKTITPEDTPEETLANVLAWRPHVVVVDVWLAGPWSGAVLASVLEGCGTTVVVATASPGCGCRTGARRWSSTRLGHGRT